MFTQKVAAKSWIQYQVALPLCNGFFPEYTQNLQRNFVVNLPQSCANVECQESLQYSDVNKLWRHASMTMTLCMTMWSFSSGPLEIIMSYWMLQVLSPHSPSTHLRKIFEDTAKIIWKIIGSMSLNKYSQKWMNKILSSFI